MRAPSDGLEELRGLPLFAAVVAHELRNPLSAVKIALQTLERQASLNTKDDARLRIALREVATIEQVLTDVLEWARPAPLAIRSTTVQGVLELARARLQQQPEGRNVRVEFDDTSAPATLNVDPARLAEALCELISNAIQASPSGGTVRVTIASEEESIRFTITDEGSGLTEEDAERAFDPFFSRRARGIGLGLPRARDIVEQLGGEISLRRRLAGGARATIRLPASPP